MAIWFRQVWGKDSDKSSQVCCETLHLGKEGRKKLKEQEKKEGSKGQKTGEGTRSYERGLLASLLGAIGRY